MVALAVNLFLGLIQSSTFDLSIPIQPGVRVFDGLITSIQAGLSPQVIKEALLEMPSSREVLRANGKNRSSQ